MTYQEKLKDHRWIMKANDVKLRDNYTCQKCGCGDRLEVHHVRYLRFTEPWNYPDNYLITLCRNCHQEETDDLKILDSKIESMLTSGFFGKDVLCRFNVSFHPRIDKESDDFLKIANFINYKE